MEHISQTYPHVKPCSFPRTLGGRALACGHADEFRAVSSSTPEGMPIWGTAERVRGPHLHIFGVPCSGVEGHALVCGWQRTVSAGSWNKHPSHKAVSRASRGGLWVSAPYQARPTRHARDMETMGRTQEIRGRGAFVRGFQQGSGTLAAPKDCQRGAGLALAEPLKTGAALYESHVLSTAFPVRAASARCSLPVSRSGISLFVPCATSRPSPEVQEHDFGTRETFGLANGCHQDRGRALSNKVTAGRDRHFPPAESDSSEASGRRAAGACALPWGPAIAQGQSESGKPGWWGSEPS